jgi:drug/metabolite transporter (DMT)-like permease
MQLIGILCSTGAALFWASAVIMFKKSGETFSPMALNLFKGSGHPAAAGSLPLDCRRPPVPGPAVPRLDDVLHLGVF